MDANQSLDTIAETVRQEFAQGNRILSFAEWLELFHAAPYRLSRAAPQYVADMFDAFGESDGRLLLFDLEFLGGEGRVHGQEEAENEICRLIHAAANVGRSDKLILMHGPNGSGKSVIVEAIFRGLEHYSEQPEGALYRFNWVFPADSGEARLGFRSATAAGQAGKPDTFAHLTGDEIAARLICEVRDNPLFLVPREERVRLLEAALAASPEDAGESYRWLLEGELCQKCKEIYEGLLAGYQGDWLEVIRHVQVERYFISQRYRSGVVTILPMASADASEQQITADLSLQNLPPVLQNLKIFEPFGDLIDANTGVVEFGDFLKRPMDLNKYLLNAIEKGTIALSNSLVHLNLVMLGTSNEKHLDHFKSTPEWTSFKGRIELVPVPYILEYRKEAELYVDLLEDVARETCVSPHACEIAALWAVLTRLLPPESQEFEGRLKELVEGLTPLEKAFLYQDGTAPARLEREDRQILAGALTALQAQRKDSPVYEGRFGASAREMRTVFLKAAHEGTDGCLTVPALFDALADLIKDKTVYDFLKLKPLNGYHSPEVFIEQVADVFAEMVMEELQDAMELVREEEYDRRFDEYMTNVIAFNRNEKVPHPQTGKPQPPNEKLMSRTESLFGIEENAASWRKDLVGRIGAYAVDHPEEEVDFRTLFPDLLKAVKDDFFAKREKRVRRLVDDFLKHGTDEFDRLAVEDRTLVETVRRNMTERFGYCPNCMKAAIAYLKQSGKVTPR